MALRRSRTSTPTIALAGAGSIAVVHALAAQAAGLRVSAVASEGGRTARHLAGQLDARWCRPEDLPAGADLLVVATPPDSHIATAVRCLGTNTAVLIEKPISDTLASADRLAEAEPGSPTSFRVAENLLHAPSWRAVMHRRPSIGGLSHLALRTVQPPPDWGHFLQPLTAGGVLFDLGPHAVAIALALAAEPPVAVSAAMSSTRPDGADDHTEVRIRFASGLVAGLEVSWNAEFPHWEAEAAGRSGVLRLELIPEVLVEHDGEPVEVELRRRVPDPRLEQLGYVDQLLDTLAARSGGADHPGQTVTEAIHVLEVIYAAYASAGSQGAEVTVPFTGDRTVTPLQHWRGG